jgi:hypothetical protein
LLQVPANLLVCQDQKPVQGHHKFWAKHRSFEPVFDEGQNYWDQSGVSSKWVDLKKGRLFLDDAGKEQ